MRSRASRLSSRLSSRRASRLMRPAASCRLSCRLACSSCRFVSRRFVLLFARSRLVRRGVIALRSPCRFVLPCRPACPCVPSARLVSVVSFPLVISFGLARVRLVSVLMPGSRVRAVSFCSSLVPTRYPPPPVRLVLVSVVVWGGAS